MFWAGSVSAFDHSHADLNILLEAHVDEDGLVDYKALATQRAGLDSYLEALASVSRDEIDTWSRKQKLAYWMNAYNAYTLKVILDNRPIRRARGLKYLIYPENSIRQIPGVWDSLRHKAGGRNITLGDIEHKVLREELDEPLIHFTIVCASIGCPELAAFAYTAEDVNEQMNGAAQGFVRDAAKNRLDTGKGVLQLSKIFKWFAADFKSDDTISGYGKYDGVVAFFLSKASDDDRAYLKKNKVRIEWLEYDWSLNEQ